jgi:hypothetical protein
MMAALHDEACCASLPQSALELLADARGLPGISLMFMEGRCWVHWPVGHEEVTLRVLAVPGVKLFVRRDKHWYRPGHCLPAFDVPEAFTGLPLHEVLIPASIPTKPVEDCSAKHVRLQLVREDRPYATTALRCPLTALARWADSAMTVQVEGLRGALAGTEVVLRGSPLPILPGSKRYWGDRVLLPLGFRMDPDLPQTALQEAIQLKEGQIAFLDEAGVEVIPGDLLRPLSRASIRLALPSNRLLP